MLLHSFNKGQSLFEALEMCVKGEVKSDWAQVNLSHDPQTNLVTHITYLSLLLCVCLFGFVSGNWFICAVSWIKGTAKHLWWLILKTSVQTYLHKLFLQNSNWFIPPCPRLGENQLLTWSQHWLSSELIFQLCLCWCSHLWAQLA